MDSISWVILAIMFAAVEFGTVALVSIWFVGGAIAAFAASLLNAPLWLQIVIFAVTSALLLLLARPFLKKFVEPHKIKTNVDAMAGKKAIVIETVDNLAGTGAIRVNGNTWTARSVNDTSIPKDAVVEIRGIDGVKAMVVPVNTPADDQ